MACSNVCKLCPRFIMSTSVTVDTDGNVVIGIPAGAYNNNHKYCLVIAQSIPTDATIGSLVYVQPAGSKNLYPLQRRNCTQATVCSIRTRTRYSTVVHTNQTSGAFRLCGNVACAPDSNLTAIS